MLPLLFFSMSIWTLSAPPLEGTFQIEAGSKLYLVGTTNVNTFTCNCQDQFSRDAFTFQWLDAQQQTARFTNTALKIKANSFDCGGSGINRDMQKTLKADAFPHIRIRMEEILRSGKIAIGENWTQFKARTTVTIAGVDKRVELQVKARKLKNSSFQFAAATDLNLTDFKLEMPRPLMGMIKVNDKITIHLDLIVVSGAAM